VWYLLVPQQKEFGRDGKSVIFLVEAKTEDRGRGTANMETLPLAKEQLLDDGSRSAAVTLLAVALLQEGNP
jgi:hypothetical protein